MVHLRGFEIDEWNEEQEGVSAAAQIDFYAGPIIIINYCCQGLIIGSWAIISIISYTTNLVDRIHWLTMDELSILKEVFIKMKMIVSFTYSKILCIFFVDVSDENTCFLAGEL